MAMDTQRPAPKIGVDKLHYFRLLEDTKSTISYGSAVPVEGSVKIGFNIGSRVENFNTDNGPYAAAVSTGELKAVIEGADYTPAMLADWDGSSYAGGLFEFSETETRYFCIAWRIKKSDSSYRYIRLYKGMFNMPNQEAYTGSGGSVKHQTSTVEFSGVKTANNGKSFAILDDDDPNLPTGITKKDIEENWFRNPVWTPADII